MFNKWTCCSLEVFSVGLYCNCSKSAVPAEAMKVCYAAALVPAVCLPLFDVCYFYLNLVSADVSAAAADGLC